MRRSTRRQPALRLLLLSAAVLLGVLGMHALSGGPHAPGGGQHSQGQHLAQLVEGVATRQPVLHGLFDDVATTATEAGAVAAQLIESDLPSSPSDAMFAMCLAVLLGLGVLLGLRTNSRTRGRRFSWPFRVPALRFRELMRAPPRDLLTRLCVLRT